MSKDPTQTPARIEPDPFIGIPPCLNLSELLHECMQRDLTVLVFTYPKDRFRTAHTSIRIEHRGEYICNTSTDQGNKDDCLADKYRPLLPQDLSDLVCFCIIRCNLWMAQKNALRNPSPKPFQLTAE